MKSYERELLASQIEERARRMIYPFDNYSWAKHMIPYNHARYFVNHCKHSHSEIEKVAEEVKQAGMLMAILEE